MCLFYSVVPHFALVLRVSHLLFRFLGVHIYNCIGHVFVCCLLGLVDLAFAACLKGVFGGSPIPGPRQQG